MEIGNVPPTEQIEGAHVERSSAGAISAAPKTPSVAADPVGAAAVTPARLVPGRADPAGISAKQRPSIKPSQYLPCAVAVEERKAPAEPLDFGPDLNGVPITCRPKAAYSVRVTHPSAEAYHAVGREPSRKAGMEETGIFYEVDAQTLVRARDRALATHGSAGHDVFRRSAAEYEEMGAKLYVNESGEGGMGARTLPDGRIEAIAAFNMKQTAENPGRISLDVARRGIMKLTKIDTAECLQGLADMRLALYGYKTVATVPIRERMPKDWPVERQDENLHSLVLIPDPPPPSDVLDKPPVECRTLDAFYQAGRDAHAEMYKRDR